MKLKSQIMDEASFNRTLVRIAHQIIEKNNGIKNLCLIGIKTRGVPMANIIADNIQKIENRTVKTGILDITLYRDDLSIVNIDPIVNKTDIPFDITGMNVVLIDDVLFTGRTARAAMDAVTKLGRPSSIQLAVLVDRGHRELPIRADFVGKNLPTSKNEIVCVHFNATDQKQNVELYEK